MIGADGAFWNGAIYTSEHNHVLHEIHEVSFGVKITPFIAMLLGLGLSYLLYMMMPHIREPIIPCIRSDQHLPVQQMVLRRTL